MQTENKPAISIIMAAHNEQVNIDKVIGSIIDQTFTDWELIVIDDGSTDGTYNVVKQFTRNDQRIKLYRNEHNIGLAASLNKGIELASADFIARADADDINLPERLQKQYEYMLNNPEIDVLGTGAYLIAKDGNRKPGFIALPSSHEELSKQSFLKSLFFHSSVLIRRRFFEKTGLYNETYLRAQDKELWIRGLSHGCNYANLNEPLIEYCTNDYNRSLRTIYYRTITLIRISRHYKIKHGIWQAIIIAAYSCFINFRSHFKK